MLTLSRLIEANYYRNQFGLFIVYGQQGIGKSVYAILAMRELGIDWKTTSSSVPMNSWKGFKRRIIAVRGLRCSA